MYYTRSVSIVLLVLSLLPFLVSAAAFRRGGVEPSGSCDPASIMCCASAEQASSLTSNTGKLLDLLNINIGSVTGLVVTCNPITIAGISGTSCVSQPVCCSDNKFNGIVALGCTAINL